MSQPEGGARYASTLAGGCSGSKSTQLPSRHSPLARSMSDAPEARSASSTVGWVAGALCFCSFTLYRRCQTWPTCLTTKHDEWRSYNSQVSSWELAHTLDC